MEVHRQLGCGFLEAVYHEALGAEFEARSIDARHEVELPIFYKNKKLQCSYRVDFVCFQQVIVELKAVRILGSPDEAQIINYLRASKCRIGLLLNFGGMSLEYRRFAGPPTPSKVLPMPVFPRPESAQSA